MPASDLQTLMKAAEQAAATSDYPSAERALREAASIQEAELGPNHPDLANTFNNLGVVCEYAGKPEEAERWYQRAYTIATTTFPPDHPFVATSRKNLEDLREQLGRHIDEGNALDEFAPSEEPYTPEKPQPSRLPPQAHEPQRAPPETAPIAPSSVRVPPADPPSRVISWGAVSVIAISLAIAIIGWLAWPSSREAAEPSARETAPSVRETASTPAAVTPPPQPEPVKPVTPATPPATPPAPSPDIERETPRSPARGATAPTKAIPFEVAEARLCRSLSTKGEWRCDPVNGTTGPGTIYFYTRVASPAPARIQHRWYFGGRLIQNVMLDIQANARGYRTFSKNTVRADGAGEWTVELRTQDGRVLKEERFTVR